MLILGMRKIMPWVGLAVMAACGREVVWPAASSQDLDGGCYLVRRAAAAARVVRVSGGEAAAPGWNCDPDGAVALSADGRRLYYGNEGTLYLHDCVSGKRAELASFAAGEACEFDAASGSADKISRWRCRCRYAEICEGPDGTVAFRLENVVTPLPDAKTDDYTPSQRRSFRTRASFGVEEGLYVVKAGAPARFLGPTRRLFGFVDAQRLLVEHAMTAGVLDLDTLAVKKALPPDAHELGFLPAAAAAGGRVVIAAAKADEKSDDVLNRIYLWGEQARREDKPAVVVRAPYPVSRVALSGDGRYAAVEVRPLKFGGTSIYAVDLERRVSKRLVAGGRLIGFAAGGRAVYYLGGDNLTGDVFLVGLDGRGRRLTATGDYAIAP